LSKRNAVTIYEREDRPGGHSHTVDIDYDGTPLAVDIGFITYNEANYPDLTALFHQLGIGTVETSMSFAVTADAGRFECREFGKSILLALLRLCLRSGRWVSFWSSETPQAGC